MSTRVQHVKTMAWTASTLWQGLLVILLALYLASSLLNQVSLSINAAHVDALGNLCEYLYPVLRRDCQYLLMIIYNLFVTHVYTVTGWKAHAFAKRQRSTRTSLQLSQLISGVLLSTRWAESIKQLHNTESDR